MMCNDKKDQKTGPELVASSEDPWFTMWTKMLVDFEVFQIFRRSFLNFPGLPGQLLRLCSLRDLGSVFLGTRFEIPLVRPPPPVRILRFRLWHRYAFRGFGDAFCYFFSNLSPRRTSFRLQRRYSCPIRPYVCLRRPYFCSRRQYVCSRRPYLCSRSLFLFAKTISLFRYVDQPMSRMQRKNPPRHHQKHRNKLKPINTTYTFTPPKPPKPPKTI